MIDTSANIDDIRKDALNEINNIGAGMQRQQWQLFLRNDTAISTKKYLRFHSLTWQELVLIRLP